MPNMPIVNTTGITRMMPNMSSTPSPTAQTEYDNVTLEVVLGAMIAVLLLVVFYCTIHDIKRKRPQNTSSNYNDALLGVYGQHVYTPGGGLTTIPSREDGVTKIQESSTSTQQREASDVSSESLSKISGSANDDNHKDRETEDRGDLSSQSLQSEGNLGNAEPPLLSKSKTDDPKKEQSHANSTSKKKKSSDKIRKLDANNSLGVLASSF